eukprot:8031497-Pyramimonas_sp.AAC.1
MAKMVLSTDTSMREFWESQQRTKEAITDCQKISLANAVCLDYSKQPGALADTTGKGTEIASVMLTAYKKLVAFMEKPPEFTDVPVGQETFAKLASAIIPHVDSYRNRFAMSHPKAAVRTLLVSYAVRNEQ